MQTWSWTKENTNTKFEKLKEQEQKGWGFIYARILSRIRMSSKLYCYVNAKKLLNKTTFKFHCGERIRQSIEKYKMSCQSIFNIVFL